ncbi:Cell division control protein 3 [Saitoella coloradoensis]
MSSERGSDGTEESGVMVQREHVEGDEAYMSLQSPRELREVQTQASAPTSPVESLTPIPSSTVVDPTPAEAPKPTVKEIIRKTITGYVGFANLPNQWHRKATVKGFAFNLMVCGESGLGKTTLVNTLFAKSLEDQGVLPSKVDKGIGPEVPKTVEITNITANIEESGVRCRLTVVDTPGFGDYINNDLAWRPILDNIEKRFNDYLDAENAPTRTQLRNLETDKRIHALLYFIQPTGHSLKPIDIEVMKRLCDRVNLIPVIAKADTLTDDEVNTFKARVRADIEHHGIKTYKPEENDYDDEDTIMENREFMAKMPFAVVGSMSQIELPGGRRVRGRKYPWGVIEVDNEDHCDFVKLREMLVRTHMEELKDRTAQTLYESYRTEKLMAMGISQDASVFKEISPQAKLEEERHLHEAKLAKMENEMKLVFAQKVAEKEQKLRQSEEELYARHREMKEQLEKQKQEIEQKKIRIEAGTPTMEVKTGKRGKFSLGR